MNIQADVKLIDKLVEKEVFNCASCNNLLQVPIMLVDGVGNMCHSCYEAFKNNDNVAALENVALNIILDHIEIPCTYKTQGCEKRLKYKDFQTHKDHCAYATYSCDFSPTCPWTGCFAQLASHCRDHEDIILRSNTDDCYEFIVMQDFEQSTYILGTSCGLFFLKMKMLKDVLKILIYDFTHYDKTEYNFDITFEADSGRKYTSTCKAINDFKSFVIFDKSLVLHIDMDLVNNFIFFNETNVEMHIKLINGYKTHIDQLLPLVRCSKCHSHIRSEIYVCANGHNSCTGCKKLRKLRVESCSLCSQSVVRCQPLEILATFVHPPCRFNGCPVKVYTSSHEQTCIFKTWNCFIYRCNYQLSYPELILHAKNHHRIPNGFINLPGLKIKRKVAERQVYHVSEYDLLFELIYENKPTRITKQGDSDSLRRSKSSFYEIKPVPAQYVYDPKFLKHDAYDPRDYYYYEWDDTTLTDLFIWKVYIIGEYDIDLYKFEVDICFGKANPIEGIILKGSCKNKSSEDHTNSTDSTETTVKLSDHTLEEMCSAKGSTFDYKVRVFKES